MITSVSLEEVRTIACFLDSLFVVGCIFLFLFLFYLEKATLWISRIFLFSRIEKTSLILRILEANEVV